MQTALIIGPYILYIGTAQETLQINSIYGTGLAPL